MLAQDFHAHRALARNDIGIVEGMDEGQFFLLFQDLRVRVGVGEALAGQHHLAAEAADRVDLYLRAGGGHDDDGAAAQPTGRQRHALGVVAGRRGNHPAVARRRAQVGHLVVRAAQLEAEYGLGIFALEQDRVRYPLGQQRRRFQRRFDRDVINLGSQDAFQIIGGHGLHVARKVGKWGRLLQGNPRCPSGFCWLFR
ncbi:hypothetical protein D9M68_615660 [compost metagenome]